MLPLIENLETTIYMKKFLFLVAMAATIMMAGCSEQAALKRDLKQALKVAVEQDKQQAQRIEPLEDKFPRTFEKGEVKFTGAKGWVS